MTAKYSVSIPAFTILVMQSSLEDEAAAEATLLAAAALLSLVFGIGTSQEQPCKRLLRHILEYYS